MKLFAILLSVVCVETLQAATLSYEVEYIRREEGERQAQVKAEAEARQTFPRLREAIQALEEMQTLASKGSQYSDPLYQNALAEYRSSSFEFAQYIDDTSLSAWQQNGSSQTTFEKCLLTKGLKTCCLNPVGYGSIEKTIHALHGAIPLYHRVRGAGKTDQEKQRKVLAEEEVNDPRAAYYGAIRRLIEKAKDVVNFIPAETKPMREVKIRFRECNQVVRGSVKSYQKSYEQMSWTDRLALRLNGANPKPGETYSWTAGSTWVETVCELKLISDLKELAAEYARYHHDTIVNSRRPGYEIMRETELDRERLSRLADLVGISKILERRQGTSNWFQTCSATSTFKNCLRLLTLQIVEDPAWALETLDQLKNTSEKYL